MKTPKKKAATKRTTKSSTKPAVGLIDSALGAIRDFASAVTKSPEANPTPRATDLLVHHHRKVEKLFERLQGPKVDFDATLRELADDLSAHIAIEEKLFYPAVRKLNVDIVLEGLEEHAMGRFELKRLLGTRAADASLKVRIKALKELMTNHHEEEEKDLFPKVKKILGSQELEILGQNMSAEQAELEEKGEPRDAIPGETAEAASLT